MNLTQLRYFFAIAQSRNLTRAATELRVAQPALSRQIRLLEEELGTPLLARHHRGVELTDAGLLLQQRSDFLLRRLEETRTEIMDLSSEPKGQLRIGCPPALTRNMIAPTIEHFIERYPKVRVRLQETISDSCCQAVLADQLDFSIVSTRVSEPNLVTVPLYSEAIWLIGPPSALKHTPVKISKIARLPMVLALPGNAGRAQLDHRMADAGLPLNVIVETNSIVLIHELVRKGVGYTVAPYSSYKTSLKDHSLSGAPIEDLAIERSFIRRIDRPVTGAMQAFLTLFQETFPELTLALAHGLAPHRKGGSIDRQRRIRKRSR